MHALWRPQGSANRSVHSVRDETKRAFAPSTEGHDGAGTMHPMHAADEEQVALCAMSSVLQGVRAEGALT